MPPSLAPRAPFGPDAVLFAALIGVQPTLPRRADPDVADLVLRLAASVRQTTAALREASACLQEGQTGPRLAGLLAQAEAASLDQADCATRLLGRLAGAAAA